MRFKLEKASDWFYEEEIQINSLEELISLSEECGHRLVIDRDSILIYDNYIE